MVTYAQICVGYFFVAVELYEMELGVLHEDYEL